MTTKTKDILLLASEFPPLPGGIGNHAYNLAKYLQEDNFEVTVLADQREGTENEREFDNDLPFQLYRIKLRTFRFLMYFMRVSMFFKLIKKNELVIISGKYPLWLGALATFFYKRKYIAVIHGSEVNFTNSLIKKSINFSLKRFHKVIAVSNYTKALVSHLNLKNIIVIPNGFDNSKWDIDALKIDELEGNPSLLTVGNVTDRKGQLNVIKHLPSIIKKFPNVHYHCVGITTQKKEFLEVAKTLNVSDKITFHGKVSHGELERFYRSSDIFIMLSSETDKGDVEGFGIALIEANYFSLPTIGALNCGIEDAISDGKSGILIDHNNAKELIAAIESIIENKERFNNDSKDWALRHDWQYIIQRYITALLS